MKCQLTDYHLGNVAVLPLRTRTRGPAQQLPPLAAPDTPFTIDTAHTSYDPVDEILSLFRANTFFRNFEIHGPADRLLIYGILYTSSLLAQVRPTMSMFRVSSLIPAGCLPEIVLTRGTTGRREAEKALLNIALDTNFPMPGDASFPLNQAFEAPRDRGQSEMLRQYLSQVRQEVAARLLDRLYAESDAPSKVSLYALQKLFSC